ncbi:uncharacterized protein LOC127905680 [Populus trichocarpa]|uniref:uncharacterized protein LOC127905680 n=1 Tax=Populus trichocarpa TaxID=3694 RepID=UPI002278B865|nr:uncharacterized protein LOC127905680 [Populus trichocarpa]
MALVIGFVDRSGFIRERFLDIVHVKDTTAATLKEEISCVLSHHNLDVQNIRGQGYDGASNMRGEWNAREISDAFQAATIEHLVDIGEIETGKGVNQVGGLQRPGDNGSTYSQRGDAAFSFKLLMSFDFAFILHIMKDVMGITDMLCQALQQKSQDILNAMHLVTTTKTLIQKLRDDGWKTLLEEVTSFCKHQDIEVPDMDACFSSVGRSRRKQKSVTVEHHYRVDIFTAIIDQQLQELNNRFNEQAIELLKLSTTLDPRNSYKLFNVKDICLLVDKFYPQDFSNQEKIHLRLQLQHYELDQLLNELSQR